MIETISIYQWLFVFAFWLVLLIRSRKQITYNYCSEGIGEWGFIIAIAIFSTFAFLTGDFSNYRELYNLISIQKTEIHLEPFYCWLIFELPDNYYIWRFVVWGTATVLLAIIYKKTSPNFKQSVALFIIMALSTFPNLRNNLGLIMLYFAMIYLLFSKRGICCRVVICIFGIICAFYLHKSMFMYILLVGLSLIPLNRAFFISSLALFPIIYKVVPIMASLFLTNSFASEDSIASGQGYIDSDFNQTANFYGLIQLSLWRIPVLLLIFYAIINIYFKKERVAYKYKIFLNYSYLLLYIAFLFYGQPVSAFFSSRFQDAVMVPLTIFLGYYLTEKPRSGFIKSCLYFLILANIYDFAYILYKNVI